MSEKLSDHYRNKVKPLFTNNANKNPYNQTGHIYTLVWSPLGDAIAFNSPDKSITIAKVAQSKITSSKILSGHGDDVVQLQFPPNDPQTLLSASYDKTLRLWDLTTCSVTAKAKIDCGYFDISPDGTLVSAVGRDSSISFFEFHSLKLIRKQQLKVDMKGIRWGPGGDLLYLITGEGSIVILSYSRQKVVHTLNAHTATCQCLQFDPSGRFWAVGSSDATLSVWDAKEHVCLYSQLRLDWPVRSVGFSYDGNLLAVSSEEDGIVDVSLSLSGTRLFCIVSTRCLLVAWSPVAYLLCCVCQDVDRNVCTIKLYGE